MPEIWFSQLKPALELCWKNRAVVGLCGLIDIIFLIFAGLAHYELFRRITGYVETITTEMQKATMDVLSAENVTQIKQGMLSSPSFMAAYHQILKHLGIFLLALLIAYIILKGINWYIANRLVKKKVDAKEYMKLFARFSILWAIMLLLIIILMGYLTSYSQTQMLPLIGSAGVKIITILLLAALAYFAFISYSLNKKAKEVFRFGIKNWKKVLPAHIIVLIITFLSVYIPFRMSMIQQDMMYWITLAFVILIAIPALTYGRIYILLVINKITKNG